MSEQTLNVVVNQAEMLTTAEQIELVACIMRRLQTQLSPPKNMKARDLLEKTYGIWQHGDGLHYQQKLRAEWDSDENSA